MDNRTKNLIDLLAGTNSCDEISRIVNERQNKAKLSLINKGYKFREGNEDLEGLQSIRSKNDIMESKYYEELNFIKRGLNTEWSHNFSDYERFKEIQHDINDILIQFD